MYVVVWFKLFGMCDKTWLETFDLQLATLKFHSNQSIKSRIITIKCAWLRGELSSDALPLIESHNLPWISGWYSVPDSSGVVVSRDLVWCVHFLCNLIHLITFCSKLYHLTIDAQISSENQYSNESSRGVPVELSTVALTELIQGIAKMYSTV